MKTRMIIATLLVALCSIGCKAERSMENTSTVNDKEYTRTFDVKDFTGIKAGTIFNITFTQGKNYSIKATSYNQEMLNRMEVRKVGSALELSMRDNHKKILYRDDASIHVQITAPDLQQLNLSGAITFTTDRIETKSNFELHSSGATKVTIESLQCNTLSLDGSGAVKLNLSKAKCESLKLNGSGAVKIAGTFDVEQDADISNSGAVKGEMEINAKSIRTRNSGAVNVEIKVNCNSLDAENSGAGKLTITGTADKTDFHNSGVSRINTRGLNQF